MLSSLTIFFFLNCVGIPVTTKQNVELDFFFFSLADNNWYRAVILEVGEKEVSVLYADYGNSEKVAFSRILPIPINLLELPFQITRCTLAGKAAQVFFVIFWALLVC